jgi:Ala-tRNA(Pro) deacylase
MAAPMAEGSVHDRIVALLADRGVPFRETHHAPVRTSEEAAAARGEPMAIGGKSLVLRVSDKIPRSGDGGPRRTVQAGKERASRDGPRLRDELRTRPAAEPRFVLFVLPAAMRLPSAEARRATGARRSRFATERELRALTHCVPGCVPPFGEPILPLPLYAHRALLRNDRIAFTPGVRDASILMATADWARLARPRWFGGG